MSSHLPGGPEEGWVAARSGRLGRPRGGIDVRGDGSVEAWLGLVRKRLLDGPDPVVALGEALAAS